MKTLSIVTSPYTYHNASFIIEHKEFSLSIITSVYNFHFFKICIVSKGCDYRQGSTVLGRDVADRQVNSFCTHHPLNNSVSCAVISVTQSVPLTMYYYDFRNY